MSIATLKRKTFAKYNSMSVNKPQFSLNGFYRNDRSTPSSNRTQTSIPRTLARGNQLRGFGGYNGTFKITNITPLCEQPNAEQPQTKTVKTSTMNTSGLIATKYLWTKLPNPYTWVKRQNSALNSASSTYTANLTKQASGTIISTTNPKSATLNQCNFTQDPSKFVAIPQNQYILNLGGNCVNGIINNVYVLPTNLSGIPVLGGGSI
jgi:hypothetical protein